MKSVDNQWTEIVQNALDNLVSADMYGISTLVLKYKVSTFLLFFPKTKELQVYAPKRGGILYGTMLGDIRHPLYSAHLRPKTLKRLKEIHNKVERGEKIG